MDNTSLDEIKQAVQQLRHQLLIGCNSKECTQCQLCRTSIQAKNQSSSLLNLDDISARILAVQLAHRKELVCRHYPDNFEFKIISSIVKDKNGSFIEQLYKSPSYAQLFGVIGKTQSVVDLLFGSSANQNEVGAVSRSTSTLNLLSQVHPVEHLSHKSLIKNFQSMQFNEFLLHVKRSFSDQNLLLNSFAGQFDVEDLRGCYTLLLQPSIVFLLSQIQFSQLREAMHEGILILLAQISEQSHNWRWKEEAVMSMFNTPLMPTSSSMVALTTDTQKVNISSSYLNLIVALLECPLLDYSQYIRLAYLTATIIARFHKTVKKQLVVQFAGIYQNQPEYFLRIINLFRRIVCERYQDLSRVSALYNYTSAQLSAKYPAQEPHSEDAVICSVRMLSLLYNVNEYSSLHQQESKWQFDGCLIRGIVPFWYFYCSAEPIDFGKLTGQLQNINPMSCPVLGLKPPDPIKPLPANIELKQIYFNYLALHMADKSALNQYFSLLNYPFLIDIAWKNRLLRIESLSWMSMEFEESFVLSSLLNTMKKMSLPMQQGVASSQAEQVLQVSSNPYLVLDVNRHNIVNDTMNQLALKKFDLHKPLKVRFTGEEGLDQGGVQKEFFQLLIDSLLQEDAELFVYDQETRLCWINGFGKAVPEIFNLFGMIIGLALYNNVMINLQLPLVFYKKLLYERKDNAVQFMHTLSLDDLYQIAPQTSVGLKSLLQWDEVTQGSVQEVFCRCFDIEYASKDSQNMIFQLCPDGSKLDVRSDNREQYVELYIQHVLVHSVSEAFNRISAGFWSVASGPARLRVTDQALNDVFLPSIVALIVPEELLLLLTGLSSSNSCSLYTPEAFKVLRDVARYEEYSANEPYIDQFWKVLLEKFSDEQRRKLLLFVTASDRIPLAGLKEVSIVIQKNGANVERLPTALTCFSRLLLPQYINEEKLLHYLSLAVEESKGFGLI